MNFRRCRVHAKSTQCFRQIIGLSVTEHGAEESGYTFLVPTYLSEPLKLEFRM